MPVLIMLALAFFSLSSHADIFTFSDLNGYQKCLATDHLEENTTTATGSQKKYWSAIEIQVRCIDKAAVLLGTEKSKDKIVEFLNATKAVTSIENSLPIVLVLVNQHRAACNDMAVYRVFLKALSYPKSRIASELVRDLKKSIHLCLEDKTFGRDFLEEKDNADTFIKENACELLKSEKLVKQCDKN